LITNIFILAEERLTILFLFNDALNLNTSSSTKNAIEESNTSSKDRSIRLQLLAKYLLRMFSIVLNIGKIQSKQL